MLADLLFAIAHFLLIFALVMILTMELMLLKPGLTGAALKRLGSIDSAYGIVALLLIVAGAGRVHFGEKGDAFYVHNPMFWLKMALFVAVGLLSIAPTLKIIGWRRAAKADPAFVPAETEIRLARRYVHMEATLFVLIPVFASLMARGYFM